MAIRTGRNTSFKKGIVWHKSPKKVCALCHRPITFEEATLDHIIPFSMNGSNRVVNLQLAHSGCNKAKGNEGVFDPADTLIDDCGRLYLKY